MGVENVDPSRIEVMTGMDFITRSTGNLIARLESEGAGEDDELLRGLKSWRARQSEAPATLPEIVKLVTYRLDEGEVIDPETGSGPADKEK